MLSSTTNAQLVRRLRELNAEIERNKQCQRLLEAEARNLERRMEAARALLAAMEQKP